MTDLEITKLCAEAMGLDKFQWQTGGIVTASHLPILTLDGRIDYDPLNDDAQAMALVKQFKLHISYANDSWQVCFPFSAKSEFIGHHSLSADLNCAICGCVAKMQAAK
ncbi:MAG: hypothetical protein WC100_05765 [Sterolibacterium sp.]